MKHKNINIKNNKQSFVKNSNINILCSDNQYINLNKKEKLNEINKLITSLRLKKNYSRIPKSKKIFSVRKNCFYYKSNCMSYIYNSKIIFNTNNKLNNNSTLISFSFYYFFCMHYNMINNQISSNKIRFGDIYCYSTVQIELLNLSILNEFSKEYNVQKKDFFEKTRNKIILFQSKKLNNEDVYKKILLKLNIKDNLKCLLNFNNEAIELYNNNEKQNIIIDSNINKQYNKINKLHKLDNNNISKIIIEDEKIIDNTESCNTIITSNNNIINNYKDLKKENEIEVSNNKNLLNQFPNNLSPIIDKKNEFNVSNTKENSYTRKKTDSSNIIKLKNFKLDNNNINNTNINLKLNTINNTDKSTKRLLNNNNNNNNVTSIKNPNIKNRNTIKNTIKSSKSVVILDNDITKINSNMTNNNYNNYNNIIKRKSTKNYSVKENNIKYIVNIDINDLAVSTKNIDLTNKSDNNINSSKKSIISNNKKKDNSRDLLLLSNINNNKVNETNNFYNVKKNEYLNGNKNINLNNGNKYNLNKKFEVIKKLKQDIDTRKNKLYKIKSLDHHFEQYNYIFYLNNKDRISHDKYFRIKKQCLDNYNNSNSIAINTNSLNEVTKLLFKPNTGYQSNATSKANKVSGDFLKTIKSLQNYKKDNKFLFN